MSAKDIRLEFIARPAADAIVRRFHYSGNVVKNSQVSIGVFLNGRLEGALEFGPPLDRRRMLGIVQGTLWNDMLELNRMAFGPALPRNSESRALAIAFRMLRKAYPNLGWVVSFADGTRCGDGTIYRAAGFVLTAIRRNSSLWARGDDVISEVTVKSQAHRKVVSRTTVTKASHVQHANGGATMKAYKAAGYAPLPGFQLRYIYFLKPELRERLTCPVLPFSDIEKAGAGMYLGRPKVAATCTNTKLGGSTPTRALHPADEDAGDDGATPSESPHSQT